MDGDLPAELTSFVGRETEARTVTELLTSARLLTLAGPGGSGKTRLAARVAAAATTWPDGVYWADLTRTADPDAVFEIVARALSTLCTAANNLDALTALVRDRRFLLCVDNCEHVVESAADVVGALLRRCPEVTVLTTSREPLRVPGETVWRIPPLNPADSVALFRTRAGIGVVEGDAADAVRTACVRLEGMPLAIELAAAWSGALSPQDIVRGLDDRFRLLVRGPHGVAERHQTLAASMDWSHALLGDADRALFDRLGVFHGGFTADAVAASCAHLDELTVVVGLRKLIDKSLLVADTHDSVTRYRMLETVREYAVARLADADDVAAIRDRHLAVYLARAESVRHLQDTDMDAWRAAITADYENYRAAITWGLAREDPGPARALTAELAWLWHYGRRGREGMDLLRRAIALGVDRRDAVQARLLTGLALVADTVAPVELDFDAAGAGRAIAAEVGDRRTESLAASLCGARTLFHDSQATWDLAEETAELARMSGSPFARDAAYVLKGLVCHLRDDHEQAMRLLRLGADGLVLRNDRSVASLALAFLATSAAYAGDLPKARELAEEAISVTTPLVDDIRLGSACSALANVEGLAGRMDQAWRAMDPVLRLVAGTESPPFVPDFVHCIGYLHLWSGEPDRALPWFERELAVFGDSNQPLAPLCHLPLAEAKHQIGDADAARAHATTALTFSRELGMPRIVAGALAVLAEIAAETDLREAANLHHEALTLRADHGLRLSCVDSLEAIAAVAHRSGATVEAARIIGACDSAREHLGYPRRRPLPEGDPGGRAMSLDEAIAYARRSRGARSRPPSGLASLTPTERDVVEHAAAGLTNPEIGVRLFMSRATVKTHLSHVYAKLGIDNRTQLAAMVRNDPSKPPPGQRQRIG
ncbi:Predicted ATPase [Actinokineospora alba]|uniref:Predicted ATPase n=1 Tax=Actinokineospora alba TaxID=504798 RepID=A0A1H0NIM7_9PSEU|nr:LuxR C-terminal-related transcriptional regulator [Actinokineospora alba]TDP68733.1 putative ATPase [Actinokineospora alba]SDH85457.1 Predicted ATPase [Actinokineospora alba]SDO92519.1 Predicted ATPase [Actinokineospora alba]